VTWVIAVDRGGGERSQRTYPPPAATPQQRTAGPAVNGVAVGRAINIVAGGWRPVAFQRVLPSCGPAGNSVAGRRVALPLHAT
jgi:hypothetical protein